jgi:hypothetical protein
MDPLTVTLWVRPFPDGHFRIVVASPHYDGEQDPLTAARSALSVGADDHRSWWHAYWNRAAAIKVSSKDGSGAEAREEWNDEGACILMSSTLSGGELRKSTPTGALRGPRLEAGAGSVALVTPNARVVISRSLRV